MCSQQFGTEIKTPPLCAVSRAIGGIAKDLPRRDEDERVFLIIIFLAPVCQVVGTFHILQENDIQIEILAAVGYRACYLRAFQHIDEGIPVFYPQYSLYSSTLLILTILSIAN